jgi:Leucine-rich repeat (LRR) protein
VATQAKPGKAAESPNPVVINEQLILAAVSVKDTQGTDGKESKKVDTEIDPRYKQHVVMHKDVKDIISLNLSFSNIAKIQNLVGLTSLRKLKLNSNTITKIENLEDLTNLEWLNLSFNNITKIENLGCLKNLTDLSLAHNQIETLENLEENTQLNVLCMAQNLLNKNMPCKEIIVYLNKLPKLQAISFKQNG